MKVCAAITQADELYPIALIRKGTISPPWSKMLKIMLRGATGVKGTLPSLVCLMKLSILSQAYGRSYNEGWT